MAIVPDPFIPVIVTRPSAHAHSSGIAERRRPTVPDTGTYGKPPLRSRIGWPKGMAHSQHLVGMHAMDPTIKLALKTDLFQFVWLKTVTGFDQSKHCEECLKGKRSSLIPPNSGFPAGFVAEGRIEAPEPFVYLCGCSAFSRYYDQHLHVLMVRDETSIFTHEDANVCLLITGMRQLTIEPVPGAADIVPKAYWTCRNWQAGWQLFPADRKPLTEVPGARS